MKINNATMYYEDPFLGPNPEIQFGSDYPDGDAEPWASMPIGSEYIRKTTGFVGKWYKVEANSTDQDWVLLSGVVSETFGVADCVDATTTGTYTFTGSIPIGAFVTQSHIRGLTGVAGDTSATITIGEPSGGDVDRYNTGTPNVFTTAEMIACGVPSGTKEHIAAITPTAVITTNADFTSCVTDGSGKMTIAIFFQGVV